MIPTPALALAVKSLDAAYDGSQILRNVSLSVPERQVVCLMGRNGVGKTTTLKCIVGLVKPVSGEVMLANTRLNSYRPDERARSGLGYVPQGRDIFPNLTVWENLRISLVVHKRTGSDQVDRVLQLFPVLKEMLKRKGGVLSGGQQQQLAIARALLTDPKVLILDEPTEGIQPNIVSEIADILIELNQKEKLTILLVEQKLTFARRVGQRFVIMDRGRSVAQGDMPELNEDLVQRYLTV
jgi:urea transport system ATP-binding protein